MTAYYTELQSVLFDKQLFTKTMCCEWLNRLHFFAIKPVYELTNFYKYALRDPVKYQKFQLQDCGNGVTLIIGHF